MTDFEIHEALLVAVRDARGLSDGDRATALDELNRHQVGCRPLPWRDCPVIVYYARVHEIDLASTGPSAVPGPRVDAGRARSAKGSAGRGTVKSQA